MNTTTEPADVLAPLKSISLPDVAMMGSRASRALEAVKRMDVTDEETKGFAIDELRTVKSRAASIESQRTSLTGPLNAVLKGINDLFRAPAAFCAEAEQVLKGKILAFDQEQARKAAEERRKAEEIAAKERQRLADEAAAQQAAADKLAQAAAAARAAGDEQAAQLAAAEADRARAESQAAATSAQLVVAAPAAEAPVKTKGVSTSKAFDYELVDLHALIKHVAEHPEKVGLLVADSVKLRAYVKSLGLAANLPGVRVVEKSTMSVRA